MAGSAWTNQLQNLIILSAATSGFSGFFAYSPAPGAGKLVVSNSVQALTDPFGNKIVPGLTSYVNDGGTWVATALTGGSFGSGISFFTATSEAGPWTLQATIDYAPIDNGIAIGATNLVFNTTTTQLTNLGAAIPVSSAGITTVAQVVSALISVGVFS